MSWCISSGLIVVTVLVMKTSNKKIEKINNSRHTCILIQSKRDFNDFLTMNTNKLCLITGVALNGGFDNLNEKINFKVTFYITT